MKEIDLILLVDDSETDNLLHRIGLGQKLKNSTIVDFLHAENALNFLLQMQESSAEKNIVILLDIHMPEMSGWEFLEKYGATVPDWLKERIRIVVLSADETQEAEDKAKLNPYVNDFRLKPFNVQMFIDLVDYLQAK